MRLKAGLILLALTAVFVATKMWYSGATNAELTFLLKPVSVLVGAFTGVKIAALDDGAFYLSDFEVLINKSCSGFNFMLICSFSLLLASRALRGFSLSYWLIFSLASPVLAYLITLIANASRILVSIIGQNLANLFLPPRPHLVLHDIIGTFVYLGFLIVGYLIFSKYLLHVKHNNAKLY